MPDAAPFKKKIFSELVSALTDDVSSGAGGRTRLTDSTEGSVVRTLLEAFARELAVAYEQLDIVYRAGYLETAEGAALDKVVALLGVERQRAGFLVGTVEFSRARPSTVDIVIPAGTRVAGQNVPQVETSRDGVMPAGKTTVSVDVQSLEVPDTGVTVDPGTLNVMPRPVAGIEQVSNPLALIQRQSAETDAELRARTQRKVRSANTGTLAAIEQAVRGCGLTQVKVLEDLDNRRGEVTVVIGDTNPAAGVMEHVHQAVAEVRPAGLRVWVDGAPPVSVQLAASLQLNKDTPLEEQQAIQDALVDGLKQYFATLGVGEPLRAAKLRSILTTDPRIIAVESMPRADGTDALPFLDPYVGGQQVGGRVKMSNGDIVVAANERVVLNIDGGWPLLSLVAPGVRLDVALTLYTDQNQAAAKRAATTALTAFLARKIREFDQLEQARAQGMQVAELSLGFNEMLKSVTEAVTGIKSVVFTVVHERDGRVAELTSVDQKDRFEGRERARLGSLSVTLANG